MIKFCFGSQELFLLLTCLVSATSSSPSDPSLCLHLRAGEWTEPSVSAEGISGQTDKPSVCIYSSAFIFCRIKSLFFYCRMEKLSQSARKKKKKENNLFPQPIIVGKDFVSHATHASFSAQRSSHNLSHGLILDTEMRQQLC